MHAEAVKYVPVTVERANHMYGLCMFWNLGWIVGKATCQTCCPGLDTEVKASHSIPILLLKLGEYEGSAANGKGLFFFFFFKASFKDKWSWSTKCNLSPKNTMCSMTVWLASVGYLIALPGLSPIGDEPDWKPGKRPLKSLLWLPLYLYQSRYRCLVQQGFLLEERVPKRDTKCQAKPLN